MIGLFLKQIAQNERIWKKWANMVGLPEFELAMSEIAI